MNARDTESEKPFEALTSREFEILSLLAEGLSDREIADRLTVAYTTVKWYNRQIFNKLGVENRRQAIERGKNLNLLQSSKMTHDVKSSLPAQTTRFVGRTQELATLTGMLHEGESRLITILASGGMGKTRLALAAAEVVIAHFPNGAFFVPLTPLSLPDQMVSAIAESAGFQFAPDSRTPKQQLLDFLHGKQILLVLDNFEHLLEGAPLVTDILQGAPNVVVLVTSRERLNLSGEVIFTLGGMSYPEQIGGEEVQTYSALQLFEQCARRMRSDFSLAADSDSAAHICRLVQGMPLAIELAAAWVNALSLSEIAEEIRRNLDFLQTRMRDVPERLRSIRAVFESTWKRLSEGEQAVFSKLSVFRRGCTRESARVIAGADIETLTELVNKALVWRIPDSGRYEVHELLRQYAEQELEAAGEAEATRAAHTVYFADFSRRWGDALKGQQQVEAIGIIEADMENVREALQRSIERGNLDLTGDFTSIWFFYEVRGRWYEGMELFSDAAQRFEGEQTLAFGKILLVKAIFAFRLWLHNDAETYSRQSLEIFQQYEDEAGTALALTNLGNVLRNLPGRFGQAEELYREALAVTHDDLWITSTIFNGLGRIAQFRNDSSAAEHFFRKGLSASEQTGNVWGQTFHLSALGGLALNQKNYSDARRFFQESLRRARIIGMPLMIAGNFTDLGEVALAEGHYDEATRLFKEGLKIERETGNWIFASVALDGLGRVALAEQKYPQAHEYFRDALKIASEFDDNNQMAFILLHEVELMHRQSHLERAVEIGTLIRPFYVNDAQSESLYHPVMEKLQTELSSDKYAAAVERGMSLKLEDVVAELLAE